MESKNCDNCKHDSKNNGLGYWTHDPCKYCSNFDEWEEIKSNKERKGNWIQVYSGNQFWPLDPRLEDIRIEDIAHSLSMLCRFGGHCEKFYSVAEHSVHLSRIAPRYLWFTGLLHDASEAYLCDVPRPIKDDLGTYKLLENAIQTVIYNYFGIPMEWVDRYSKELKSLDDALLMAEARDNMKKPPAEWSVTCKPANIDICCWVPEEAEKQFMSRFYDVYPNIL